MKFNAQHELSETYFAANGSVVWIKAFEYDDKGNWIRSQVNNRVTKFGKTYDQAGNRRYRTIEYFE